MNADGTLCSLRSLSFPPLIPGPLGDRALYRFSGLFTRENCDDLNLDRAVFSVRDLRSEYDVFGIRFSQNPQAFVDDVVDLEALVMEVAEAGVSSGLAISYSTFGGRVEYLEGFEIANSQVVPKSRFSSESLPDSELASLFVEKMRSIGIELDSRGYFRPFERGFWNE